MSCFILPELVHEVSPHRNEKSTPSSLNRTRVKHEVSIVHSYLILGSFPCFLARTIGVSTRRWGLPMLVDFFCCPPLWASFPYDFGLLRHLEPLLLLTPQPYTVCIYRCEWKFFTHLTRLHPPFFRFRGTDRTVLEVILCFELVELNVDNDHLIGHTALSKISSNPTTSKDDQQTSTCMKLCITAYWSVDFYC